MAKRTITAEELMKQLESNPQWVTERDARAARQDEIAKRRTVDQASLVSELAAVGVYVASVYDFVMAQRTPLAAIPVLVRHLESKHDSVIREGIIRSLGFIEAREFAFEPLCRHYNAERDSTIQFVIANALSGMARFDEVSGLPGMERYESLFKTSRR